MRAAHAALLGASLQGANGDGTEMSCPPTCCFNFCHLAAVGQDGSEGRTRRVEGSVSAEANQGGMATYDETMGSAGIEASCLRNFRLFIRFISRLLRRQRAVYLRLSGSGVNFPAWWCLAKDFQDSG
jgi:hypothetical protein